MKLDRIKGQYDYVISLGHGCGVAEQLKRNNLRKFSGPLDWFITSSTERLVLMLKTKFEDFMLYKNLEITGIETSKKSWIVSDVYSLTVSVHDFILEGDQDGLLPDYGLFKEKINRRIERFYNIITNRENKILFIRTLISGGGDIGKIEECLTDIGCFNFKLLALSYSDKSLIEDQNYISDKSCAVRIYNLPDVWSGDDDSWKILLNGITVS